MFFYKEVYTWRNKKVVNKKSSGKQEHGIPRLFLKVMRERHPEKKHGSLDNVGAWKKLKEEFPRRVVCHFDVGERVYMKFSLPAPANAALKMILHFKRIFFEIDT